MDEDEQEDFVDFGADDEDVDDTDEDVEDEYNVALEPLSTSDVEGEEAEEEEGEDTAAFDTELPARHDYLGQAQSVPRRINRDVDEDEDVQELLLLALPGLVLMPGQTMPITLFRFNQIDAVKRVIDTTRTFASVHVSSLHPYPQIGTTAEIYEFRDPPNAEDANNMEIGFKLKVRGRERFRLIESHRQLDGTMRAKVRLLPEVVLQEPLRQARLRSADRFRVVQVEDEDADGLKGVVSSSSKTSLKGLVEWISRLGRHKEEAEEPKNNVAFSLSRRNQLRSRLLSPHPHWVFEMYDANILVERVHDQLASLRLYSDGRCKVPTEPIALSYWVGINLPLDDAQRLEILDFDCAIQRLRYELVLIDKCQILCCRRCNSEIGAQKDIFSMSTEGPQNAYVNTGGYVHNTLTLKTAKGLRLVGEPSTEFSWFPGYAWTIAQCGNCDTHIGWKFTATRRNLTPKKFFGVSGKSIRPLMEMSPESPSEEEDFDPIL